MLETLERAPAPERARKTWWRRLIPGDALALALVAAVLLGIAVRAWYVLRYSFPLNDGGLFYQMARDLQANDYRIPEFTTYNGAHIPFGYPPFGMYLAAFLNDITPLSLMTLFRILPMVATAGTVVAFALLARRLLPSRLAVIAATVAFALVPRSFVWLLMGGGVTRSFGLLFALLALHEAHRMYTERRWRFAASTTLLSALTVLSHLETGWFLAFSAALMFLLLGRSRRGLLASAAVGAGVVVLTAPWWVTVASQDGLSTFRDAQASGGSIFSDSGVRGYVFVSLGRVVSTSEPWFPLIGVLGLLGVLASVVRRQFFLPAWWAVTIVLDPRAFPTFTTVPVSLLAGLGLLEVVIPAVVRLHEPSPAPAANGNGHRAAGWHTSASQLARQPAFWVVGALFAFSLVGAFVTKAGLATEADQLRPLSQPERDVMAWIRANTPPDARFLVVPRETWEVDRESEWFPVLAGRISVTTVQGFEWTPLYGEQQDAFWRAYECGFRTVACLADWRADTHRDFTYVWVPRENGVQCCTTLLASMRRDPGYATLYNGPGGTIFVRTAPPAELPPWPPEKEDDSSVAAYAAPPPPTPTGSTAGSAALAGIDAGTGRRRLPFSATR